jgi:hypothetical protein
MYKLRSRIVNFRVTDEELERLQTASATRGSRCLSDFARSVILETANAAPASAPQEPIEPRILSLEQRLDALESDFQTLQSAVAPSIRGE